MKLLNLLLGFNAWFLSPKKAGRESCKKISSFAVSDASLSLSLAIARSAKEKTSDEGADVAECTAT